MTATGAPPHVRPPRASILKRTNPWHTGLTVVLAVALAVVATWVLLDRSNGNAIDTGPTAATADTTETRTSYFDGRPATWYFKPGQEFEICAAPGPVNCGGAGFSGAVPAHLTGRYAVVDGAVWRELMDDPALLHEYGGAYGMGLGGWVEERFLSKSPLPAVPLPPDADE